MNNKFISVSPTTNENADHGTFYFLRLLFSLLNENVTALTLHERNEWKNVQKCHHWSNDAEKEA